MHLIFQACQKGVLTKGNKSTKYILPSLICSIPTVAYLGASSVMDSVMITHWVSTFWQLTGKTRMAASLPFYLIEVTSEQIKFSIYNLIVTSKATQRQGYVFTSCRCQYQYYSCKCQDVSSRWYFHPQERDDDVLWWCVIHALTVLANIRYSWTVVIVPAHKSFFIRL